MVKSLPVYIVITWDTFLTRELQRQNRKEELPFQACAQVAALTKCVATTDLKPQLEGVWYAQIPGHMPGFFVFEYVKFYLLGVLYMGNSLLSKPPRNEQKLISQLLAYYHVQLAKSLIWFCESAKGPDAWLSLVLIWPQRSQFPVGCGVGKGARWAEAHTVSLNIMQRVASIMIKCLDREQGKLGFWKVVLRASGQRKDLDTGPEMWEDFGVKTFWLSWIEC